MDLGAQGNDVGNGQSSDYEQGYDNTNPQNIAPESSTQDLYDNDKSPTGENANPPNDNKNPSNKSTKPPADTPQKPKAGTPKKEGSGNQR